MPDPRDIADPLAADIAAIQRIPAVDRILSTVCRLTGLGFAAVGRVIGDRWVACAVRDKINVGFSPGSWLPLSTTICQEIRSSGDMVVIDHVDAHPIYSDHPTPRLYDFQSYVGLPIRLSNGEIFGTLCAFDRKPKKIDKAETIESLKLFAELIAMHLDKQGRGVPSEAVKLDAHDAAKLQDQLVAALSHDLRNPLSTIGLTARQLATAPLPPEVASTISTLQQSVNRLSNLTDNLLDFARARLGNVLDLQVVASAPVLQAIVGVTDQVQAAHPNCLIERDFAMFHAVDCDPIRIAQLLAKLLENAAVYGECQTPIVVRAATTKQSFELSVTNTGPRIPDVVIKDLFKPFARDTARPGQQGLGLSLYIVSQIAAAHAGRVSVSSTDTQTRFVFGMPRRVIPVVDRQRQTAQKSPSPG